MHPFVRFSLSYVENGFWQRMVSGFKNSVIYDLLSYLYNRYFTVAFGSYENFTVSQSTVSFVSLLIPAILIALIASSVLTSYTRAGLGKFVHTLLAENADSPETAKTLLDLGFFRSAGVRRELSRGYALRKLVKCKEEEDYLSACKEKRAEYISAHPEDSKMKGYREEPFRVRFETAHFYLPKDLRVRAEIRFEKRGSEWWMVPVSIAASLVLVVLICKLLPPALSLVDIIISFFRPA